MSQTKKPGRPLLMSFVKWSPVLPVIFVNGPHTHNRNHNQKISKIYGLIEQTIPIPQRCICGRRLYSYTHRKIENEKEHYCEIFARCVNPNCRYMRRYLPSAISYKWSRSKSAIKELAKIPTFYELDGQLVEEK